MATVYCCLTVIPGVLRHRAQGFLASLYKGSSLPHTTVDRVQISGSRVNRARTLQGHITMQLSQLVERVVSPSRPIIADTSSLIKKKHFPRSKLFYARSRHWSPVCWPIAVTRQLKTYREFSLGRRMPRQNQPVQPRVNHSSGESN